MMLNPSDHSGYSLFLHTHTHHLFYRNQSMHIATHCIIYVFKKWPVWVRDGIVDNANALQAGILSSQHPLNWAWLPNSLLYKVYRVS